MARTKGKKNDGRASDITFKWMLTTLGPEWEQWQELAAEWMAIQHSAISHKREALTRFFESYLRDCAPYAVDVSLFFKGYEGHLCSTEELESKIRETVNYPPSISDFINHPCKFIDYIIEHQLSEEDDSGNLIPLVRNPLSRIKRQNQLTETVRNPLPYKYIEDLRHILCPLPDKAELAVIEQNLPQGEALLPSYNYRHFKHWTWAQMQTGQGKTGRGGSWFDVEPELIDKADPDCVWRTKEVKRKGQGKITTHQMWSPVKAMVILMKLHLPLRTYQVSMLDSGEADTWRYESGQWKLNDKHGFALGSKKRPFGKGIFRRIHDAMTGQYSAGLYVNTNKTADQNKDELERGYIIPWQNEEVLYWLEKLRNWQEKYNPIVKPTDCTTLQSKNIGKTKSQTQLESLGEIAFLFRDASAKGDDKYKPFYGAVTLASFWYQLLLTLENQLAEQGNTLDNGERLKLVVDYPEGTATGDKVATNHPLHSLRVSLITAYTMDTQLPLPVISKLLAGHSRILMTIYYNKITPSVMAEKMNEAEGELEGKAKQSVRNFLKDASLAQIQCKMAYNKEDSIQAALVNRNPIGWEERSSGLCLVGGNTVKSDEVSTLGGCWNGGELITSRGNAGSNYASVPQGPENCIRCRWFITEARYLPALNAQFNQLSYKAHQAAKLSVEIEGELEALKDKQFFCEEQGTPFTKHDDMQVLQRRYEKQQVEADEYVKDWIACFGLISKIIHVEEARNSGDTKDKLIAVGGERDISHALKFIETDSELLHLSLLCDDAEFFPDLQDELRKTPAIEKRSRQLSRALMKKGFEPIFMEMDEKQQLIAGNAMLRQMAKIADPDDKMEGYRKVANYIEAGEYLSDNKLFSAGWNALSDKALRLESFTQPALLEK